MARLGIFRLAVQPELTRKDVARGLTQALRGDPRVQHVEGPDLDPYWDHWISFYPNAEETDPETLATGADRLRGLRFRSPFRMEISVPKKNQPKFSPRDVIPSDTYKVLWDGQFVLVAWSVPSDQELSMAGGHVAADVLRDAVRHLECELLIQACEPGCDFMFIHANLRIDPRPQYKTFDFQPDPDDFRVTTVRVPLEIDYVEGVYDACRTSVEKFAEMKNIGRRILDIENATRDDLAALLAAQYDRAAIAQLRSIQGIKVRWARRDWRRATRKLLARLWMNLGNLERLKRSWEETSSVYARDVGGRRLLFDMDIGTEQASIESLNLQIIAAAVEQSSTRLDNRSLTFATAGGAIAGAAAGGLFSLLIQ